MAKGYDWISDLPADARDAMLSCARIRRLPDKELIYARGDPTTHCFQIISGGIRRFTPSADGQETLFDLHRPGDVVGDSFATSGAPYPVWIESYGKTVLRQWSVAQFRDLRTRFSSITEAVMAQTCHRLEDALRVIDELSSGSVAERVAGRLSFLARCSGNLRDMSIKLSQADIAAMSNSTRQTVNIVLKDMERRGILDVAYGKITLHDVLGLQSYGSSPMRIP